MDKPSIVNQSESSRPTILSTDQSAAHQAKRLYTAQLDKFDEELAKDLLIASMPEIYLKAQYIRVAIDTSPDAQG